MKHRHLLIIVVKEFAFKIPPLQPVKPGLCVSLIAIFEKHVLIRVLEHGLKLLLRAEGPSCKIH